MNGLRKTSRDIVVAPRVGAMIIYLDFGWEATSGFEPLDGAFAELCLTTWRRRPVESARSGRGAGDGDRTRDFLLGKEMLYH